MKSRDIPNRKAAISPIMEGTIDKPTSEDDIPKCRSQIKLAQNYCPIANKIMALMGACH